MFKFHLAAHQRRSWTTQLAFSSSTVLAEKGEGRAISETRAVCTNHLNSEHLKFGALKFEALNSEHLAALEAKVRFRVNVADPLNHRSDNRVVIGDFTAQNIATQNVAQDSAEVFVPRE